MLDDDSPPTPCPGPLYGRMRPIYYTPHPLTACPEPDSQCAASKVSLAVLCPQVAKPGFGLKQSTTNDHSGIHRTLSRGALQQRDCLVTP